MRVEISKLIDGRNECLWNEIITKFKVEIQTSPNPEYACFSQGDIVIFFIPFKNHCPDSFTHELLHIYIRLKEIYIGSNLTLRICENEVLRQIFNNSLLEHISNCLDHIKMLPIFLEMGFRRDKFLLDYHEKKCTEREITDIRNSYKIHNRYDPLAVEIFVGKFFAVKADPNESYDYEDCLLMLKKIDKKLFTVLDDFVDSWIQYDLEAKDIIPGYRDLVDELYDGLESWISDKDFN